MIGISAAGIQAPSVNLETTTMRAISPVDTAPTPLIAMWTRQFGSASAASAATIAVGAAGIFVGGASGTLPPWPPIPGNPFFEGDAFLAKLNLQGGEVTPTGSHIVAQKAKCRSTTAATNNSAVNGAPIAPHVMISKNK